MSLFLKRVIMVILGIVGAFAVWPCLLIIQYFQMSFSGYFMFSLFQGLVFGCIFGAIFGSFEGIVVSSRPKAVKGLLFGSLAGLVAGAFGVIAGQAFLFYFADIIYSRFPNTSGIGIIFANGVGWVIIGVFVAMIEGFRARSIRKIFVGLAGGIVGGLIGGATLQTLLFLYPSNRIALLAGLVLFGFSLSFFYSLFENRFSLGSIKLLNGPLKNKEYHLIKQRMSIGSGDACDIVLAGYRDIDTLHAFITVKKGRVNIVCSGSTNTVKVNDETKKEASLRREDVFAIGNAKFMYGIFS